LVFFLVFFTAFLVVFFFVLQQQAMVSPPLVLDLSKNILTLIFIMTYKIAIIIYG